jgi:hypothetical protein
MQSILHILKVNDSRKGVSAKTGRPYEMQDAECCLITDTGEVDQVGVLQIPRELMGKVVPGHYIGSFSLRPDMASRRINAVLVGLQPYAPAVPGSRPAAPASPSKA